MGGGAECLPCFYRHHCLGSLGQIEEHYGFIVEDELTILGLGSGKIFDGFDKLKTTIYPNEIYRHISRIDSVEIINVGAAIYYSNYWYVGKFNPDKVFNKDLGKVLGKRIDMDGE